MMHYMRHHNGLRETVNVAVTHTYTPHVHVHVHIWNEGVYCTSILGFLTASVGASSLGLLGAGCDERAVYTHMHVYMITKYV